MPVDEEGREIEVQLVLLVVFFFLVHCMFASLTAHAATLSTVAFLLFLVPPAPGPFR